ncbi:MAG: 23S rRNA (uracil(1939)-C(5))-methyltransferase RlmD [Ruminococcaceae bacterium]|nr:23S rRNA (uracil(1939)-C(5))-methyltransferase RlmD [Oscillospiraceae bacterium]
MNKNDKVIIDITDISSEGFGVGKVNGFTLFVPQTAVGDRAEVLVVKLKKNYGFGKLISLITKSDKRTDTDCATFSQCGGCVFRHISYDEELRLKTKRVSDAFSKIASMNIKVHSCMPSETYGYRNKAVFPIGKQNKKTITGFYAVNSHRIVAANNCEIQNPVFNIIAAQVRKWADSYNISAYDEETQKGVLRHLFLRIGEQTKEILCCLVINADSLPYEKELISILNKLKLNIVGVCININKEKTNVIMGSKGKVLYGRDYILDVLCGLTFKISLHSFYQINRQQAQRLYQKALELANPNKDSILLDMYCGAGTIGLTAAKKSKKIYGIEIVEDAIKNAQENAKINEITNAEFYAGNSSMGKKWLEQQNVKPDIIIVDPPRKGCDSAVLEDIKALAPEKIVYVSCDPATLARDVKILCEGEYTVKEVFPFDMFPRTAHVESVVCLTRRLDVDMRR